MSAFLSQGAEALWQSRRVRILEAAYNGMVLVVPEDDPDETPHEVPAGELQSIPLATPVKIEARKAPDPQWNLALKRAQVCRQLIQASSPPSRTDLEKVATQLNVSVRTVQRDMVKMRRADHPMILLPRSGGRPIGHSAISYDVEVIIREMIEPIYLQGHRPALHELAEEIRATCRSRNLAPPVDETVRLRIERMDAAMLLKRRHGAKAAKYKLKPMVGHIDAELPFECIQIDHTLADVILRSDDNRDLVLGRPWVTLAIDVRTRKVVGVYVSFDPPSATSVALCVINVLLPKEAFLKWLGIQGSWPSFGRPRMIYVDNGKDFHSRALHRGCEVLGIDLQYRPVGSPHYGGLIERLIGTMMGRCRLLPGATQRDVRERGDYDSEKASAMTLGEFRPWFVNEIVTQYHLRPHRALGHAPLIEWEDATKQHGQPEPIPACWSPFEVLATFLPSTSRRIHRYGIEWENHTYWHPALAEWIGCPDKREIFFDPRDIRFVYLRGPNGQLLRAEVTQPNVPAISLGEWKADRAYGRQRTHDPALLAIRDAGLEARRTRINDAIAATSKHARSIARANHSRKQQQPGVAFEPTRDIETLPTQSESTTSGNLAVIYDGEIWS
jgi:putative transposase